MPVCTDTPPTRLPFSMTSTDRPSLAACTAARRPDGPLPMTTRSNAFMRVFAPPSLAFAAPSNQATRPSRNAWPPPAAKRLAGAMMPPARRVSDAASSAPPARVPTGSFPASHSAPAAPRRC